MKAAIFHGVGQELTMEQVNVDTLQDHEVLVRTAASGVCHSDLHNIDGILPREAPSILGHEAAGIVEQIGSGVTYVKPGDHIIARGAFCGECKQCLTGNMTRCTERPGRTPEDAPRFTLDGTPVHAAISSFAEQMLLHERAIVKIREDMPLDAASLIGCGVITGLGAVINTARVEPGSTVAVFGVGGIGLSAIQGAHISGARQIIAVDLIDHKLETAKQLGATHAVNASSQDPVEAIRELSDGGVDYSFEAIGLTNVTIQAVECLGLGGTATLDRRHPRRPDDPAGRSHALRREEAAGLLDGVDPPPHRLPEARRVLHAGPAEAGRDDLAPWQARRGQRHVCLDEGGRGRATGHRLRVDADVDGPPVRVLARARLGAPHSSRWRWLI